MMKRLALVAIIMLAAVTAAAQSLVRQGSSSYSIPLYNWDGRSLRQGSSRYGTVLYNYDGQYLRKGVERVLHANSECLRDDSHNDTSAYHRVVSWSPFFLGGIVAVLFQWGFQVFPEKIVRFEIKLYLCSCKYQQVESK